MSQQDLYAVLGRARTDQAFANELFQDFDSALQRNGYTLSDQEKQIVNSGGSGAADNQPIQQIPLADMQNTFKLQQDELRKRVVAQSDRMIDLNKFTADMLKQTIGHSAGTYKKITLMNQVMFWMGVSLFLFAVGYAVVTKNLTYSIAFAGLGTASFIGFFFLGPIEKTQAALSNLIQAEIAFMNYFEQMALIEGYASITRDDAPGIPDPGRIAKASEMLQQRSRQTIELLHFSLAAPPAVVVATNHDVINTTADATTHVAPPPQTATA